MKEKIKFYPPLCFLILYLCVFTSLGFGQQDRRSLRGVIKDNEGQFLQDVTVRLQNGPHEVRTDRNGFFEIEIHKEGDVLLVEKVGYASMSVKADDKIDTVELVLEEAIWEIEEIEINTGYQRLPKERSTGSFEQISEKQVQYAQTGGLLDRMEGMGNSLMFDRRMASDGNEGFNQIRLRGASSIYSDINPLIVVDNFPYEGDIESLNPNDIVSIDILRDAAATSIWGARAANGVIIINTKKALEGRGSSVDFMQALSHLPRPDLRRGSRFVGADGTIAWERLLFDTGHYSTMENAASRPALTEAVELFIKQRDGILLDEDYLQGLDELRGADLRDEVGRHLLRNGSRQQYHIALHGSSEKINYYYSGLFNQDRRTQKASGQDAMTLMAKNTFRLHDRLHVNTRLQYAARSANENGLGWEDMVTMPLYTRLQKHDGSPSPIYRDYRRAYIEGAEENGLADWRYRPIDEVGLNEFTNRKRSVLMDVDLQFRVIDGLDLYTAYQYNQEDITNDRLYDRDGYYVRNLVNRFTQADGSYPIEHKEILDHRNNESTGHNLRTQLNFSRALIPSLKVNGLLGAEARQWHSTGSGHRLYGYDSEILTSQNLIDFQRMYPVSPNGSARVPLGDNGYLQDRIDRFVSYYLNVGADFLDRYTFSLSVRNDASNLFGVRANQRWAPLWSAGAAWMLHKEPFVDRDWVDQLKLRFTFGKNGNINKNTSAYVTGQYLRNSLTGLPYAQIRFPANPDLQWETTQMINAGLDFSLFARRVSGSLEYYSKRSSDLLGQIPLESTSGFTVGVGPPYTAMRNYASITGHGLDIALQGVWIDRGGFRWTQRYLFAFTQNKVKDYQYEQNNPIDILAAGTVAVPRIGYSLDALYSIPWAGLNPENGDPRFLLDGVPSADYAALNTFSVDQLRYHGDKVPRLTASLQNTLSFRDWELFFLLTYKGDYYYSTNSVFYSNFMSAKRGHSDFDKRWQNPGDELLTDVPSFPQQQNVNRDRAYYYSDILVMPADHIRLRTLALSYRLPAKGWLSNVQLMLLGENFGTIWAKNKLGEDPDWVNLSFYPSASYSLKINLTLK